MGVYFLGFGAASGKHKSPAIRGHKSEAGRRTAQTQRGYPRYALGLCRQALSETQDTLTDRSSPQQGPPESSAYQPPGTPDHSRAGRTHTAAPRPQLCSSSALPMLQKARAGTLKPAPLQRVCICKTGPQGLAPKATLSWLTTHPRSPRALVGRSQAQNMLLVLALSASCNQIELTPSGHRGQV